MAYTHDSMYDDDEEVGGDGYKAILITLPQPATLPNKLLCVKKVAGLYRTIVSAHFTHTTATESGVTKHKYTYDFNIYGVENESTSYDGEHRVTLKGIGDCYWFISNGTNWYQITPEATEVQKGIVRFATSDEMTLSAQQIEDGEELSKTLAVNPYQADKEYMRTNASNMRFASNYIYKTSQYGAATLENDYSVIVQDGLGINIPTGRDTTGVITSKRVELTQNVQLPGTEDVTSKLKLIFVKSDTSLFIVLAKNYYQGYQAPVITNTTSGEKIVWFDFTENLLKWSDDNGTNWVTLDAAGPIAEYYGDGVKVTNLTPYAPVGFLTREELQNIYQQDIKNMGPDYSATTELTIGEDHTFDYPIWLGASYQQWTSNTYLWINGTQYYFGGWPGEGGGSGAFSQWFIPAGITVKGNALNHMYAWPVLGGKKW